MMRIESIEVNGQKYLVKIRHQHRENYGISIGSGVINIRAPISVNREQMARELLKLKLLAIKKLQAEPEKFKPLPSKDYKDGDIIKVWNEEYLLKISYKEKASSSARIKGNAIQIVLPNRLPEETSKRHISTLLSRCIAAKRLPELEKRIHRLNEINFKQKIGKIFFKNHKSKWGSCSEKGNINISTRLLFAPDDVMDYVCIHELAHLIEKSHSEIFWALVKKAMPDYKEKRQWLNGKGGELCF